MFHHAKVKRQLLRCQPFKQSEHKGPLIRGDKVIGVFNAAGAALNVLESA